MTDSMKFGPEWLRNMSADTTSSNYTSGQITNSTSNFSSGNSFSEGDESSANNVSNTNFSNINTNSLQNNSSSTLSGSSRNTFPEFRYGREEMLLLFDRNCSLPEILPSYKNLFVERVQFPLALVPSTDEEIIHGSAQQTPDRSWVERNGVVPGDSGVAGNLTVSGGGSLGSETWNGNTPVSSPRREFSNHPRNMENWRRSRNEDIEGGELATSTTFPTDSGWRINSSGFHNSHSRWGRSNSWRDDDMANSENNGSAVMGVGGVMMLRSNSTISTTHSERIGESGVSGRQTDEVGVLRSLSVKPSGNRSLVSGSIWPSNATVCPISNMHGDGITIDEMALPEWAVENPSDIGGTFDASGAFHGAVDDNEKSEKQQENYTLEPTEEKVLSKADDQESFSKTSDNGATNSMMPQKNPLLKQNDNYQNSTTPSHTPPSTVTASQETRDVSEESEKRKYINHSTCKVAAPTNLGARHNGSKKKSETDSDNNYSTESATNYTSNVQNHPTTANSNNIPNINVGDYAERMMKVTDDMIEKLIMDDEDAKDGHINLSLKSTRNKVNAHNLFIAMQQSPSSNHPSVVSPALGGAIAPAAPPTVGLYNIAGMVVDHTHNVSALHQLQQQQMSAVAAVAIGLQPNSSPPHPMASTSPTDLWLYRDPQAKVQGPFSALEMTEWYRAGYFNENLFVRRVCDARFRPLGELIKICNDQMPFSHSHLIPVDMNPTTITPPLPPVISVQNTAQATDFLITTLNEHQQQQQHEKLKVNVTAAADSLSNALKTLVNSIDISQVLNIHFQTLQERFIHNQEIEIANELSKNECFRCLSPPEKDAVVRQKLQTVGLPEYLTNLAGLSNSLAALNPTVGTQLYDTIAECTKKEQLFNNHQSQQQLQTQAHATASQQLQKTSIQSSLSTTSYMNAENFIIKTKNSSTDINSADLLDEFNLRMLLNNGSDSGTGNAVDTPNSNGHEFLNDQQLFGSGTNTTSNPSNTASQSAMMQMWMNSLAATPTNQLPSQQHSLLTNVPQVHSVNNHWLNGPLAGINSISLSTEQQGSPMATPASMWDVATLEQHVQQQQHQQQHLEQPLQQQRQQQALEAQRQLKDTKEHFPDHSGSHQDVNKSTNKEENKREMQQQQQKVNEVQKSQDVAKLSSSIDNHYKQEQQIQSQTQQQVFLNEKSNAQVNKRNSINNASRPTNKSKNENLVEHLSKKIEEERRREQNEEKRRQKEERKRQQVEEEKRRLTQAEEEKCHQMQEEEKRQQQIQAQRRKALLNNSNNSNSTNYNSNNNIANSLSSNSVITAGDQKSKEQQRIQSSVAPWSTQATKSQGPGLAEIQKAERRERRADQQRQLEIQEKQLRALAAVEAQDIVVKWNASPLLVKSFAEIQAEEAKRLANEQIELQRRKEQEAHNHLLAFSSTSNTPTVGLNRSSNLASIWSGNKIWGASGNISSFWAEPLKFNSKSLNATSSNINTAMNNNNCNISLVTASIVSQPSNLPQKPPTTHQHQHISTTQPSSNKNIKKSQSVAIMQNSISLSSAVTSAISSNEKKPFSNPAITGKQTRPQKVVTAGATGGENKKITIKSNNTANKSDDFEAEFIYWCTKTLNNMNTKVDVPTFVSFLRDLESPYEVKDYIRVYLGESKDYIDFAKQFLERRSKYKNLQRAQNAHDDDLCKPAQAITPSVNDNSENKGKQKKVKKNKMTKLDARILGFSVTAAEGRINVGDRDYVDAP